MRNIKQFGTGSDLIIPTQGCTESELRYTIEGERVIMGQRLSDIEINFSQLLLKSQFPEINGLQSTLLQDKSHMSKAPNHNKLQIIHWRTS